MSAAWAEEYGVQEHQEDEESSEEVAGKSPHEEQCDEDQAFDSKVAHALIFFFGRSNIMPALQNEIDAASRLMQENDLKFFSLLWIVHGKMKSSSYVPSCLKNQKRCECHGCHVRGNV